MHFAKCYVRARIKSIMFLVMTRFSYWNTLDNWLQWRMLGRVHKKTNWTGKGERLFRFQKCYLKSRNMLFIHFLIHDLFPLRYINLSAVLQNLCSVLIFLRKRALWQSSLGLETDSPGQGLAGPGSQQRQGQAWSRWADRNQSWGNWKQRYLMRVSRSCP